mgnify:FL=1
MIEVEGGQAHLVQIERVNVHNGTDIYDAATWQIAVELGAVMNKFSNPTRQNAYDLVSNENMMLQEGYDGNATLPRPDQNRAVTKDDIFKYNGKSVVEPQAAYFFRMVTRNWLSTDPFMNSVYASYVTATNLPKDNPDYQTGKVTWTDWKPITGENGWAFLIGPLQAAYINYISDKKQSYVPFSDQAILNAINVLPTFAAMQSPIGGVYYVPSGTLGNQGDQPVNPHMVSLENNFSLYAGLNILKEMLQSELKNENDLTAENKKQITTSLAIINVMINGNGKDQKGMLSFFKNQGWRNGEFIQGGLANDPIQSSDWVATMEPKAVDVNTWGIAALGPKQVDSWFGFGASYQAWQQVKSWGAYGQEKTLWGVGYSDKDGDGIDANGNYKSGIISAEWTAGAINMVRSMISYYSTIPAAQKYVTTLKIEESSMLTEVQLLRFNSYQTTPFPGKPDNYSSLMSAERYQPYLYSSKRYMIPFGWYANPIPSVCSTSWMIMLADNFNPFGYGGK